MTKTARSPAPTKKNATALAAALKPMCADAVGRRSPPWRQSVIAARDGVVHNPGSGRARSGLTPPPRGRHRSSPPASRGGRAGSPRNRRSIRRPPLSRATNIDDAVLRRGSAKSCAEWVGDGAIAARELVLALGAGLDALRAMADGVFDRLIIADLEMQKGPLLDRAPVAAVDGVVAEKIDRAGDIAPAAPRHDQQNALGHGRADAVEKVARQIGTAPFARAGVHVEGEERVPMRL